VGAAEAASRAGDKDDFSSEIFHLLTLIRHFIPIPQGQRALQPWAMGQCLEGHPAFP
jgi:hypothetical protein